MKPEEFEDYLSLLRLMANNHFVYGNLYLEREYHDQSYISLQGIDANALLIQPLQQLGFLPSMFSTFSQLKERQDINEDEKQLMAYKLGYINLLYSGTDYFR